jgi:Zn-dependent protease
MSMSPEMTHYVREGALYIIALVLSICVHEAGHAIVADRLGDPLPREQGRVTLNPLAHVDPVGTLLFPIIAFVMAISNPEAGARMLGWGRPVQVSLSARSITRKISLPTANILISVAGIAMNLLFALVLSVVFFVLVRVKSATSFALAFGPVDRIIQMNIGLAFFNLIPCPPLDGSHILGALMPRRFSGVTDFLDRYGFMIFFALLVSGGLAYLMFPARWIGVQWLELLTRWAV